MGCSFTACHVCPRAQPQTAPEILPFLETFADLGKKEKKAQLKAKAIAAPTAALTHQQPRLGRSRWRIEFLSRHKFSHSLQETSGAHPHEHPVQPVMGRCWEVQWDLLGPTGGQQLGDHPTAQIKFLVFSPLVDENSTFAEAEDKDESFLSAFLQGTRSALLRQCLTEPCSLKSPLSAAHQMHHCWELPLLHP